MKPLTHDEMLKLKAATLYVLSKCGCIDYYHLFKILYFADRNHYAKYGRRIVADTFCALPDGPVPSRLYDAVKAAIRQKGLPITSDLWEIANAIGQESGSADYYLYAKEQPDNDELSASDIEMLDEAIKAYVGMRYGELRETSHDAAWQKAFQNKENSPIDPHQSARAGGASDEMMQFIEELEVFDQMRA